MNWDQSINRWTVKIPQLPQGKHLFRFVVDDKEWYTSPEYRNEIDSQGNSNNVAEIPPPPPLPLADEAAGLGGEERRPHYRPPVSVVAPIPSKEGPELKEKAKPTMAEMLGSKAKKEVEEKMYAYAIRSKGGPLERVTLARKQHLKENEVEVKMEVTGVCHTDVEASLGELPHDFPFIPGHEGIGCISRVGEHVKGLKVGDRVGVGWILDSCGICEHCIRGQENLCPQMKNPLTAYAGTFCDYCYANQKMIFPIPQSMKSVEAAPLLCAAITCFPSLIHKAPIAGRVGIIGIGGLGHLAIMMAQRLGHEVIAFSTHNSKREDCLRFGAHNFVDLINDNLALTSYKGTFDLLLYTISGRISAMTYLSLLKKGGKLVIVGLPSETYQPPSTSLPLSSEQQRQEQQQPSASTSTTTSSSEFLFQHELEERGQIAHNEMRLDIPYLVQNQIEVLATNNAGVVDYFNLLRFCELAHIVPQVEVMPISQAGEAMRKVQNGEARYRMVLQHSATGSPPVAHLPSVLDLLSPSKEISPSVLEQLDAEFLGAQE